MANSLCGASEKRRRGAALRATAIPKSDVGGVCGVGRRRRLTSGCGGPPPSAHPTSFRWMHIASRPLGVSSASRCREPSRTLMSHETAAILVTLGSRHLLAELTLPTGKITREPIRKNSSQSFLAENEKILRIYTCRANIAYVTVIGNQTRSPSGLAQCLVRPHSRRIGTTAKLVGGIAIVSLNTIAFRLRP